MVIEQGEMVSSSRRIDLDLDIRKQFFTIGAVKYWHSLPKGEVEAQSLEAQSLSG